MGALWDAPILEAPHETSKRWPAKAQEIPAPFPLPGSIGGPRLEAGDDVNFILPLSLFGWTLRPPLSSER